MGRAIRYGRGHGAWCLIGLLSGCKTEECALFSELSGREQEEDVRERAFGRSEVS